MEKQQTVQVKRLHKASSKKRRKEYTLEEKNRKINKTFLGGILFLVIWLVLLIIGWILIFVKPEYARMIFFASWVGIISQGFFGHFKSLYGKETFQRQRKKSKEFKQSWRAVVALSLLCFGLSILGYTYIYAPKPTGTIGEPPYGDSPTDVSNDHIPKYNFSIEGDSKPEFDIYFSSVSDQKDLAYDIDDSLKSIQKLETIPSKEEMDIATEYGGVGKDVRDYEDWFAYIRKKKDSSVLKGAIIKDVCDYIVEHRISMDSVYQTPTNRRMLIDAFLMKAQFSDDPVSDYENAVVWAWARIYTEITWGEFSVKSIDKLIEAYEHLRDNNPDQKEQINLIISSLDMVKVMRK